MINLVGGLERRLELLIGTKDSSSDEDAAADNRPLWQLSPEEGIYYVTLAQWRDEACAKGRFLPDAYATPEGWTSRDKLAALIETASRLD